MKVRQTLKLAKQFIQAQGGTVTTEPLKTYVEVVDRETETVIHAVDCTGRNPDRVERGININLNSKKYFTRIVTPPPPTVDGDAP